MKLLSKSSAGEKLKKENDELVETNIRLRKYWQGITQRLNDVKEDYEPDKLSKLREFELFVKDLTRRKEKLLQELKDIQDQITQKKELYYALIEKQDALDERVLKIAEQERTLILREAFVVDLEDKWRQKNS